MLKIREAIVVEGKYDKIALEPLVDALIFTTEGFGLFRDKEKIDLLRRVARRRGLIILTDSDGAGFVIRGRLRGCIDPSLVKHAYIPDLPGRERRKKTASREGKLGVEGMTPEILRQSLLRAGATVEEGEPSQPVTKADLCALGLSGAPGAAERRRALQRWLGLPERLSANGLLEVLTALYGREAFLSAAGELLQEEGRQVPHQEDA